MGMLKDIAILGGIVVGAYVVMKKLGIPFPKFETWQDQVLYGKRLPQTEQERQWLQQKINVHYYPTAQEVKQETQRQQQLQQQYDAPVHWYEETGRITRTATPPRIQRGTHYTRQYSRGVVIPIIRPVVREEIVQQSGGTALNRIITAQFGR